MKLSMLDCIKIKWNNLHQTNFCSTTIKTTIFITTCYGLFITFIQCKYIYFTKLFWINLNEIFTHNYRKRCPLEPLWWFFEQKWTTASITTSGNEYGVIAYRTKKGYTIPLIGFWTKNNVGTEWKNEFFFLCVDMTIAVKVEDLYFKGTNNTLRTLIKYTTNKMTFKINHNISISSWPKRKDD